MLQRIGILLISLLLVSCRPASRFAQVEEQVKQGPPILRVGDTVIYEGRLQLIGEFVPGFNRLFATPEGRQQVVEEIIAGELMVQKARQEGLVEGNLKLQKQLWIQERDAIAGTLLLRELDRRARADYEKDRERLFTQVEIADILYAFLNVPGKTPEEKKTAALKKAEATRQKLTPENFGQIAAEETDNILGRTRGGRIGTVSHLDQRIKDYGWKPLVEAAFQLKKGEISGPILTAEGVHLVMALEEKRVQAYEEVAGMLQERYRVQVRKELLEKLKAETGIEYLDPALKPAPQESPRR